MTRTASRPSTCSSWRAQPSPSPTSTTPSGTNASFYSNQEVLDLRQAGLVGKPVYLNSHSYDWDQSSRDSERWIGQLPDGNWVVGLFNRSDTGDTRQPLGRFRVHPGLDEAGQGP